MKLFIQPLFMRASVCLLLAGQLVAVAQSKPGTKARSVSTEAQVRQRAMGLLKQMTVEEKAGQLSQVFMFSAGPAAEKAVSNGALGSVLFVKDPAQINKLQRAAIENSRLHIPLLFGLDVIHGFRTVFPVPIAMAASWDPQMVEGAQAVAAQEARASGVHWTFGPMLDIARDPRWGRIVEGAGEDPYLGSAMAAAQVRGFQGDHLGTPDRIVACAKHFAGYGAAEGGRDYDASEISDSQLWNVYLPPFKAAVDAGTGSVMSAYMDLNGVPATGNRWLVQNVLRDDWHFKGFVVSDADAVKNLKTHGYAVDLKDAAVRALSAGVNMEMALAKPAFAENLPQALKEGKISTAQLDEAVLPILETKIRLGLFENPYVDESRAKQVLEASEHRTEALHAAERSAVLLRNEGTLLPLRPSQYNKIALIGPMGDSKVDTAGPWTFANDVQETVTIAGGLKQVAPAGTTIDFAPGVQISRKFPSPFSGLMGNKESNWTDEQAKQEFDKAVTLAQNSEIAIMVLGEKQDMDGESASRSSLQLPGDQQKLLEAVVSTGKPVILLLMTARPLDLLWASAHVPAILDIWYPGTEGGLAVANLLFGEAVPGGKLPFTWPRNVGQVPLFYAHYSTHEPQNQAKRYWDEESTPLFPFGYGLSYTSFAYSNLHIDRPVVKIGGSVNVSVDIENTGGASGDEVVQLYIHQKSGTSSRPVRELKGFQRVAIAAHQKSTVQFTLTAQDLTYWSSATKSWIQDPAEFDVWTGGDSSALLHDVFRVNGAAQGR
jgi:beta-glucosidase